MANRRDCRYSGPAALSVAGFADFEHMRVIDLGLEKSNTPITDENVAKVAATGAELLR